MEITTFYPTPEEFRVGLAAYVRETVEKDPRTLSCGLAKVVPPSTFWLSGTAAETLCLQEAVRDETLVRPIKQHLSGKRGTYRVDLVDAKPLSVTAFRENALALSPLTEDREFWKSLGSTSSPAQYGADQVGTLFKDHEIDSGWNLNKIDSILSLGLPDGLGGITCPMLYFGEPRAAFAWHCEDMDFNSVNYLHFGASKVWYAVSPENAERLEDLAKIYFGELRLECREFLRHKNILISPNQLEKSNIPYCRAVQNEREFMITLPRSYHCGFNRGWNCAESVNFATPNWISVGRRAAWCKCEKYVFQCDVDQFVFQVRKKCHHRLSALPVPGDLIVIKWQGSGFHLVRVGCKNKKKRQQQPSSTKMHNTTSINTNINKSRTSHLNLTVRSICKQGREFAFSTSLDEWRYPTARDCTPHVGDIVAVKWKGDKQHAYVRVVGTVGKDQSSLFRPLIVEMANRTNRTNRTNKTNKTNRTTTPKRSKPERWTFHPREDNWYWPEPAAVIEMQQKQGTSAGIGRFFPVRGKAAKRTRDGDGDGWVSIKMCFTPLEGVKRSKPTK